MALKWGIVGAGRISHDFVTAVQIHPNTEHVVTAVGARSRENAVKFAKDHNIPKAYEGYEGIATDKNVGKHIKSFNVCDCVTNTNQIRHSIHRQSESTTFRGIETYARARQARIVRETLYNEREANESARCDRERTSPIFNGSCLV